MNPVAITRNPDSVLLREFSKLDSSFETRVYRSPEEAYLALSSAKCGALLLDLDSYQDSQSLTSIGDLLTFGVSANRFQRLMAASQPCLPVITSCCQLVR